MILSVKDFHDMTNIESLSCLHQFSWEEWDNQMIVVLYRSDRRFVVKRYIERVLANSSKWQHLAQSSFSTIEPIAQTYTMTENEIKLMHHIFSWHMNGTLTFPIIGELDQLLDWEDILNFIERVQQKSKSDKKNASKIICSPSIVPTIPIGISSSKISIKEPTETNKISGNLELNREDIKPIKIHKKDQQQQQFFHENMLSSSSNHWIQINNICVPYIIKSQQSILLPYQVLLDCDLLNEQEQSFILHFTIKASSHDIQTFERIISSSSSSIDFTLNNQLLLIDLYHLIFGMFKVVYVKLLNNQRDVNKSYKTVLAQHGGTVIVRSRSVPFINLGKLNCILLDSLIAILQPTTKIMSILRRHSLPAHSHEIDYLHLVQLYQRKPYQNDSVISNQQQHLLVKINEIHKYVAENDLVINMLLTQYQQVEHQKIRKQIERTENKPNRKQTKRKASIAMTELQNTTKEL
ncbi:unnamed protein product [Rotaria sp. Silwood1]|nr:unnamed protein product [Rotaria sp. Silwood1]CAF3477911.1 unnamed protein product [Rotaria sp. Silwood1]CAF3503461.1 unnamed protein product [Rotaria sp. Silwood1]CAF4627733.1 unnamed protein product [Rotaria sp. Silwood1]CAF4718692.1 unnamed protein product [Rotaria sp. Silwood1]